MVPFILVRWKKRGPGTCPDKLVETSGVSRSRFRPPVVVTTFECGSLFSPTPSVPLRLSDTRIGPGSPYPSSRHSLIPNLLQTRNERIHKLLDVTKVLPRHTNPGYQLFNIGTGLFMCAVPSFCLLGKIMSQHPRLRNQ